MKFQHGLAAAAFAILAVTTAEAQIVSGLMVVTGAEMH
jgi:hypothetical protein